MRAGCPSFLRINRCYKGNCNDEKNDVAMIAKDWRRAPCGNCGAG